MKLDRITINPKVMAGRACIRGMRFTVSNIITHLANGVSREELLQAFPYLEDEDITQAMHYAAYVLQEQQPLPVSA